VEVRLGSGKSLGDIEGFMKPPVSTEFLEGIETVLMDLLLFSVTFPAGNEGFDSLLFWSMDFLRESKGFELILAESLGDIEGESKISTFSGGMFWLGICQIVSLSVVGRTSISISLPR
jgi:hypothetical protein